MMGTPVTRIDATRSRVPRRHERLGGHHFILVLGLVAAAIPLAHAEAMEQADRERVADAPLPDRMPSVLFLSARPELDDTFSERLAERGISHASVDYYEPLDPAFLEQFNVFVFADVPRITDWRHRGTSRPRYIFDHNYEHIQKLVRERGAGLMFYSTGAAREVAGQNAMLEPFGIELENLGILDESVAGLHRWGYSDGFNSFAWTENLTTDHPITEGLRRIYYPTGEMNLTGQYCARPLILHHDAWTPLVRTMSGASLIMLQPPRHNFTFESDGPAKRTIAAARDIDAGRMSIFSIHSALSHRGGYDGRSPGELRMPAANDKMLESGNSEVPSDTLEMLMRMYIWLGANSHEHGLGRYEQGAEVETIALDPPAVGEERSYRVLVGARTRHSDGEGTVAEYAAAARDAGYDAILFTETFTHLGRDGWKALEAECRAATNNDFVALPGFEIKDPDNNRYIVIAPPVYPHDAWLDESGTRLLNPYVANFFWYNHHIIIGRAESSPLPAERLKHYQGIATHTYRNGELIDNSMHAYKWAIESASFPKPFAVHEIFSPDEVSRAADTGFQQYTPEAEDLDAAVWRLCRGMEALYHPRVAKGGMELAFDIVGDYDPRQRGPDATRPKAEQSFEVRVTARSDAPIADVTLYDGFEPIRRWRGNDTEFEAIATLPFDRQYNLHVIAEDARGNRALRTDFWISPGSLQPEHARFPGHFRAHDRQNWLGAIPVYYTGSILPFGHIRSSMALPVRHTEEGRRLFGPVPGTSMAVKVNFPFTSNDVVVTEYELDEKYSDSVWEDVTLAATPSRDSKPSSIYKGIVRYYHFTQTRDDQPWPGMVEYDLTLRRGVEPRDPHGLFPGLMRRLDDRIFAWDAEQEQVIEVATDDSPASGPRGSIVGGVVPLDGRFALDGNWVGRTLETPSPYLRRHTRLTGRFVQPDGAIQPRRPASMFHEAPDTWLEAMGFTDELPYALNVTRGSLGEIAFYAPFTAYDHGVAGAVTQPAELPYDVPFRIEGVNRNWSAGKWREGESIQYIGVFEDTAWPLLDVSKPGAFYAGNLVMADDPQLTLSVAEWSADGIRVEAHNRTDRRIEATVATPAEITGHEPLEATVTLEPGESEYLER